ncbi:hypothetical protein FQR65_LT20136 [Abscondita terminalis]|nr:hypothetical protein FQR65_LT20136 [Abscondita terminalis]
MSAVVAEPNRPRPAPVPRLNSSTVGARVAVCLRWHGVDRSKCCGSNNCRCWRAWKCSASPSVSFCRSGPEENYCLGASFERLRQPILLYAALALSAGCWLGVGGYARPKSAATPERGSGLWVWGLLGVVALCMGGSLPAVAPFYVDETHPMPWPCFWRAAFPLVYSLGSALMARRAGAGLSGTLGGRRAAVASRARYWRAAISRAWPLAEHGAKPARAARVLDLGGQATCWRVERVAPCVAALLRPVSSRACRWGLPCLWCLRLLPSSHGMVGRDSGRYCGFLPVSGDLACAAC